MAVIYYATDWYSVENELFSSYKNFRYEIFYSLDKMTKNISKRVQDLSREEIQCRRLGKQTLKYKEILEDCNLRIAELEKMITYANLLQ